MSLVDGFNLFGSLAGILGLGMTVATFWKVERLAEALRQRYFDRYLGEQIERILAIPRAGRKTLVASSVREIEALIHTVEHVYLSRRFGRNKKLKGLIANLSIEIHGTKRLEIVQNLLVLVRGEILIR